MDYGYVLVHIFDKDTRDFYKLSGFGIREQRPYWLFNNRRAQFVALSLT